MISDAEFALWLLRPDRDPVCTIEADYQIESSGEPVQATLYLSDKPYFLSTQAYDDCVQSVPNFQRSLSGERLGVYQSSYGKIVLNNHDGSSDYVLSLALDGSQARFKFGDRSWDIADHRLMFIAQLVRASAPSAKTIEIEIKDSSAKLDQSICGTSPVGGTGPNADRLRPINLGFVRQVECLAVDDATLLFVHSDTGVNTAAVTVRNRGEEVVFVDNGDGTLTLDAGLSTAEKGQITADVLALAADADPSDLTRRRTSDIIDALVRDRAGLGAAGLYAGAGPTFTVGDDDDYLSGLDVPDTQNLKTAILPRVVDSGNCFYAVNRLNQFTFGRLRPNDIATLPVIPFAITSDDVDSKAQFSVDHELPTYYKLQAYMSKNWKISDDLVTSLTPEQRAVLTRPGLPKIQDDAVGVTYADAPELYDLSLVVSPVIETLLSGDDDDVDIDALIAWLETARFAILPIQENLRLTTGLENYQQELGDAMATTLTRVDGPNYFGIDDGALFQVTSINLRLTDQKIDFVFRRRRLSTPYPDGWVRVTTEADADTTTSFEFDSEAPAVVVPPPVPPAGGGGITGAPWYPANLPGIGGYGVFSVLTPGGSARAPAYVRVAHFVGQVQSFADFNRSVAMDSAGTRAAVGVSNDATHTGSSVPGTVQVYERSGGVWSSVATLDNSVDPNTAMLGYAVSIADDGTIVTSENVGSRVHVFTTPGTWTHTLLRNSGGTLADSACVINRDGNIIVVVETSGDSSFYVYKLASGTWSLQQTISVAPDKVFTVDISADGQLIAVSCGDVSTPNNLTLRTYDAGSPLTTWTMTNNITPTSDNGNTRTYAEQQVCIAADKSLIALVAPDDQDGTNNSGTVFVFKNDGTGAFAQQSWSRASSGSTGLGIGAVALSDDGGTLFVGEPYFDGTGTQQGRLFYKNGPGLFSGGPTYMNVGFTEIPNPYAGTTNKQRFVEAVATSGDASRIVVASGDFNDSGSSTVDFYELVTPLDSGLVLFLDEMNGAAASFTGRSPDTGGAYTAESGSLANLSVNGLGVAPSEDTTSTALVIPASGLTQSPNYAYRLSAKFTPTLLGVSGTNATVEIASRIAGTDTWLVDTSLFWQGTTMMLGITVENADGSTVFSPSGTDVTAAVTVGVEHELTVDVGPAGIVWKIDGTTIVSDGRQPDVFPDGVVFINSALNAVDTSNINLSQVKLVTL